MTAAPSKVHAAPDDHDLVVRLRAGEPAAAHELVDRYAPRLHAMLVQLCAGDHDQAAEFTQEAFARAWERLDQFAGGSSFYTWLYRLARNRAIDLLARKRPVARDFSQAAACTNSTRHAATHSSNSAASTYVSREPTPSQATARAELVAAVRRALAELDAEAREIILLRDFDALDYDTIAHALGIALGTVKSRLSRARGALRDILAGRIVPEDLQ